MTLDEPREHLVKISFAREVGAVAKDPDAILEASVGKDPCGSIGHTLQSSTGDGPSKCPKIERTVWIGPTP